MIRALLYLVMIGLFVFVGATVKLGKRTLFGHIRAIWHTEEMQDLKDGVRDTAGPTVNRVERGVKAGVRAMEDEGSAGRDAGVAAPHHAP